jgi:hypothetical protein
MICCLIYGFKHSFKSGCTIRQHVNFIKSVAGSFTIFVQ